MNPLRRIAEDLIEKRLWPIALVLLVALVAVPLFVGGGSADPGEPELAARPASGAVEPAAPAVALVGPPAVRSRPGKLRDPFRRTKQAKKADTSSDSSGSSGAGSSGSPAKQSPSAGAATGGASTQSSSGKAKTTSPAGPKVVKPTNVPSLASRSVYETVVRFAGGKHDYEHPLDRLAVLGDKDDPALLYLGVSRGGEYAVFLLGAGATAGGDDGACIVADTCRAIGLRKGDQLEVEVEAGGAARHYTVKLTSLRRIARGTKSAAHRERQRVAKGGRAALHAFAEDAETAAALSQLRYGPLTGTIALVRSP